MKGPQPKPQHSMQYAEEDNLDGSKEGPRTVSKKSAAAEHQVHLSNYADVCALLRLLDEERKIVDAKDKGVKYLRKPRKIKYDRSDEVVDKEIEKVEKHKTILESFKDRQWVANKFKQPQDLLFEKVTKSFPLSTPVEIGPRYTVLRMHNSIKVKIRSKFTTKYEGDELRALAACIQWTWNQIEDLEVSPMHYDAKAPRGDQQSDFLLDVKAFAKELGKELVAHRDKASPESKASESQPSSTEVSNEAQSRQKESNHEDEGMSSPQSPSYSPKTCADERPSPPPSPLDDRSARGYSPLSPFSTRKRSVFATGDEGGETSRRIGNDVLEMEQLDCAGCLPLNGGLLDSLTVGAEYTEGPYHNSHDASKCKRSDCRMK